MFTSFQENSKMLIIERPKIDKTINVNNNDKMNIQY